MNLTSIIEGHPEVLGGIVTDRRGQPRERPVGTGAPGEEVAAACAVTIAQLAEAGLALGLKDLKLLQMRSEGQALVAVVRPDVFLLVTSDPGRIGQVEKLLESWQPGPLAAVPSARPAAGGSTPPALPQRRPSSGDAWAILRRALVRGDLTEVNARQGELEAASAAGRPGSEPVPAAECERALQLLREGLGALLSGDGGGAARAVRELAAASQPNQSFRWLALLFGVRASMKCGALLEAGAAAKQAVALAKQLDDEALALTQLAIGDLLAHTKDRERALAWVNEARAFFERTKDAWGLGQACLAQARVLVQLDRESEAAEMARQAAAKEPRWDEPALFLSERALHRTDLTAAEHLLHPFQTHGADRVRVLIEALRQGLIGQADASEYLRESSAPASANSVRVLERIARAAPRFPQAKVALAWMLLNQGRYPEGAHLFRALMPLELAPADRFSVMQGLDAIANADKAGLTQGASALPTVTPAASDSSAGSSAIPLPGGTLGSSSGKAFSGDLSDFSLPDLLEFLRNGRRSGLLVFTSQKGIGSLHFSEGRVTSATSPATPPIGQVLVESQQLAKDVLDAAAGALGSAPDDPLICDHLLREGLVESAALQVALEKQLGVTLHEVLQWKDGEFTFDRDGETGAAKLGSVVSVDVQGPLMRVFQEMDEAARDTGTASTR